MKKKSSFLIMLLIIVFIYIILGASILGLYYYKRDQKQHEISKNTPLLMPEENKSFLFEAKTDGNSVVVEHVIVYDGLTYDELVDKIDKSLNSTLSGTGYIFANAALEYGVDPYLAVAIALHETGCKWTCSSLVTQCYNVGGVKGSPSCNGGAYRAYDSLEDGITKFIANISNNYVAYGLTTASAMQNKYAGSTTWAEKVDNYIYSIRSK